MRQTIIIILFLTSLTKLSGQDNLKVYKYYSPYNKPDVLPFATNLIIGQDYHDNFAYYHGLSDSINRSRNDSINFDLIVDTLTYTEIEETFTKAATLGILIEQPKLITWYENDNYKQIERNKNITMKFSAFNVRIVNRQKYNQNILLVAGTGIRLIQEYLDSTGSWRSIENLISLNCGMDTGWFTVKPNEELNTRIFNYKGNFKTNLRVKLFVSNDKVIYSQPFYGSINKNFIQQSRNIIQIDGINYEY